MGNNSAGGYLGGRRVVNEFFHHASFLCRDCHDGDVVDASGPESLRHKRLAHGFRIGEGLGNYCCEVVILDHLGEPIGTEQDEILGFKAFCHDIGIRFEAEAKRSRYAWLPFGVGPRVCIGMGFALMEGQLVLARLLQRADFEIIGNEEPNFGSATLRPKYGMQVRIRIRETGDRRQATGDRR